MYSYDEDLAPPPKSRITTVAALDQHELEVGDKLVLLDQSLITLFQHHTINSKCITTVFIESVLPDCLYRVGIVDIVLLPEERILTPAGITATVTLDQIREAIRQTEALRCDKPSSSHTSQREQKRTGLDYDAIANELKQKGRVSIPLPRHRDVNSFRTSVHTAMRKRGLNTSTEIKDGTVVFTIAEDPGML